ncbi:hypothetical protein ACWPKO_25590 (plasmid) [Coraliomargarita sp. W4R53]
MLNNFELLSLMHLTASGVAMVGVFLAVVAAAGLFIALATDRADRLIGPAGLLVIALLTTTVGGAAQEWWQLITAIVLGGVAIAAGSLLALIARTRHESDGPQSPIDRIPVASLR